MSYEKLGLEEKAERIELHTYVCTDANTADNFIDIALDGGVV
jgi:hypothetical protein